VYKLILKEEEPPIVGYYNTFVIKIWRDEGIIRGHIQHVSTQEQTYFLNFESMTDFIVSHLGPLLNDAATLEKIPGGTIVLTEDFGDVGQDE